MTAPCKDCPDRHTACHDTCEKYKAFRAYREKLNADRAKVIDAEYGCRQLAQNWGKGWELEQKRKKRRERGG